MESRHSTHPCHNLSLPGKKLFWCRHCMTIFENPIDRWRHSRECKNVASTPEGRRIKDKDGTTMQMYVGINEILIGEAGKVSANGRSISTGPGVSAGTDLHCFICKKIFGTLEEMRSHVRNPCNKSRQGLDAMAKPAKRPYKRKKPKYSENSTKNSTTDSPIAIENTKQHDQPGSQVITVQNVTVVQHEGERQLQGDSDVLDLISQVIAEEEPDFLSDSATTYHVVTVETTAGEQVSSTELPNIAHQVSTQESVTIKPTDRELSRETEVPIQTDGANDVVTGKIVPMLKTVLIEMENNETCQMDSVTQDGVKEKSKKPRKRKKAKEEEMQGENENAIKPKKPKRNKTGVNGIMNDNDNSEKVSKPERGRKKKVDKMPSIQETTVLEDRETDKPSKKRKKKKVVLQMDGIEKVNEDAVKVKPPKKRKKRKVDEDGHEENGKPVKKGMQQKESDDELTLAQIAMSAKISKNTEEKPKKLKKSKKTGNQSEELSKKKDKKLDDNEATKKNQANIPKVKRPRGRPRKYPVIVKADMKHAETALDKSDSTGLKNKNIVETCTGEVSENTIVEIHVTTEIEDVSRESVEDNNEKRQVEETKLDDQNEITSIVTESVNEYYEQRAVEERFDASCRNNIEDHSSFIQKSGMKAFVEPKKPVKPTVNIQSQENSFDALQAVPSETDIMALLRSGAQVIANGEEIIIISVQNTEEDATEEDLSTWPDFQEGEEEEIGNLSNMADDAEAPPPIDIESVFPGENSTSKVENSNDALFNENDKSEAISKETGSGEDDEKSSDSRAKVFFAEKRVTRSSGRKLRGKKPEMRNMNFNKSLQKKKTSNTDSNCKNSSAHTKPPKNRGSIDKAKDSKGNTGSTDLQNYTKAKKENDLITKCENGHCDQLKVSTEMTACDVNCKTLTSKKPKLPKTPKCKICGQIFTSFPLLLRHNRFPCRVKHTRNLCQKVLRPKRGSISKELPLLAKKKKNSTKPAQKKTTRKSESKTFEKTYRTRKSAKNGAETLAHLKNDADSSADRKYFLGGKYLTLNEKEQFFMQLGMVCKGQKPEAVERTRKISEAERYALLSTGGLPSLTDEQSIEGGPNDAMDPPPPVLELAFVSYLGDRKQVFDGDEEPPILELAPGVSDQFDSRMTSMTPQSLEKHTDSVEEEDTFTTLKEHKKNELSEKDDVESQISNEQMPSSPYRQKKRSMSKMSALKHHSRPTLITEEYRKKHLTARHFSDVINTHDPIVHRSAGEKVFSSLNANVQSVGQSDDRHLTINQQDETLQSLPTSPKETMIGEGALKKLYKMINISPTKSYIITEQPSEKQLKQNTDSKEYSINQKIVGCENSQFSVNDDLKLDLSEDKEVESSVRQREDILSVSNSPISENVASPIADHSKDAVIIENVLRCPVKHWKDQGVHASEQTLEIDSSEKVIIARTKVSLPENSQAARSPDLSPSLSISGGRENRMNLFDSFSALCSKPVSGEKFHATRIDGVLCNFRSTAVQVSPIEFLEQEFSLSSALDSGTDKNQQIVTSNQLKSAETNDCMLGNTEPNFTGNVLESLAMSFGLFTGESSEERSTKTCEIRDMEKNEKVREEMNISHDDCETPEEVSSDIIKTLATEKCEQSESTATKSEKTSSLSIKCPDMEDTDAKYSEQCSSNSVIVSAETVRDQLSGLPGTDQSSQSLIDFSKNDLVQAQHNVSDNCVFQSGLDLPISNDEPTHGRDASIEKESSELNATVPTVEIAKNVSDDTCPNSSENSRTTESVIDQSEISQEPSTELVWTDLGENFQYVSREILHYEQSNNFEEISKSVDDSSKLSGSPHEFSAVSSADDESQEIVITESIESSPGEQIDVTFSEQYHVVEEVECSVSTDSSVEDVSASNRIKKELEHDLPSENESFDNASKSEVLEKIICVSQSETTQGVKQLMSVAIHSSDTSFELPYDSNLQAVGVGTIAVKEEHTEKALSSDSDNSQCDYNTDGQFHTPEDTAQLHAGESSCSRVVDLLHVAEIGEKIDSVSANSVQLGKCESRCTSNQQHITVEQSGVSDALIISAENVELDQESKHVFNGQKIDNNSKGTSDSQKSDKCQFNNYEQQINAESNVYETVVKTSGTNVDSDILDDFRNSEYVEAGQVCRSNEIKNDFSDTNESKDPVDKTDVYSNWELIEPPIDENCETFGSVPYIATEKVENVVIDVNATSHVDTNSSTNSDRKSHNVIDVNNTHIITHVSTSYSATDLNTIGILTDINTSESVADENTSDIVTDVNISESFADENTIDIVTDVHTSESVADVNTIDIVTNTSESVADVNTIGIVTDINTSDSVADENTSDIVTDVNSSKSFADENTIGIVTDVNISESFADENTIDIVTNTSESVADVNTIGIVTDINTSDSVADENTSDIVTDVNSSKSFADENTIGIVTDVNISEGFADENTIDIVTDVNSSESFADENIIGIVADVHPSESVADENTIGIVTDVNTSESFADENTIGIVTDVHTSESVADENTIDIVTDVHPSESVANANTSESVADENTIDIVTDVYPSESVADENNSESFADENTIGIVTDVNTSENVADENSIDIVTDVNTSESVADENTIGIVNDVHPSESVADANTSESFADENTIGIVTDVHPSESVADANTSESVADKNTIDNVTDENTNGVVTDVHTSESVADENTIAIITDENTIGIVTDVNTSDSVTDENTNGVVTDVHTSESVADANTSKSFADENTIDIVTDVHTSESVADENTIGIVTDVHTSESVADANTSESFADENTIGIVTDVNTSESVTDENTIGIVTDVNIGESVTDVNTSESVADENTIDIVTNINTSENVADANTSESVADANTSESVADVHTIGIVADVNIGESVTDVNTSESVADENTSESVADENTIGIVTDVHTSESVTDENTSESVADENTIGIVTDVHTSESVADENTIVIVTDENTIGIVTDENTIDIVTDVHTSESVTDENTSESVADENTIGIVTDVHTSESVADENTIDIVTDVHTSESVTDENTSESVADENTIDIVTDVHTSESVADENTIGIVTDVCPSESVADENTIGIVTDVHTSESVADENTIDIVTDVHTSESVTDENTSESVADENTIDIVTDVHTSESVADENTIGIVTDVCPSESVADENNIDIVTDVHTIDIVTDVHTSESVADENTIDIVTDVHTSESVADENTSESIADENTIDIVTDVHTSESVADENTSESIADENTIDIVTDVHTSESVTDENTSESIADENTIDIVTDVHTSESVTDENTIDIVTDVHTSESVADENTIGIVTDVYPSESVADENTIDIVTDVHTSESVADENTSESVADENTIGIVTDVHTSESVADENTIDIVTDVHTSESVTDENTSESVADENTIDIVTNENTSESVTDENTSESVADENTIDIVTDVHTSESVADENTSESVADENTIDIVTDVHTSESVTDENTSESVADENTIDIVTDIHTSESVADENTIDIVTDENTSESVADENAIDIVTDVHTSKSVTDVHTSESVTDVHTSESVADINTSESVADENTIDIVANENTSESVTDENTSESIADENTIDIVTDVHTSESVADENTSESVADENTIDIVTDVHTSESVTDENTSESVADENTIDIVTDVHTSESVTDENTIDIVTDVHTSESVADENTIGIVTDVYPSESIADENTIDIVTDVHTSESVADENTVDIVTDVHTSESVTDENTSESVADENTIDIVTDVHTSESVADENTIDIVTDVHTSKSVTDENTSESVADENTIDIVTDVHTSESVADESTIDIVTDENTSESVADENTIDIVTDVHTSESVTDVHTIESVADENTIDIVTDVHTSESVADENTIDIVTDVHTSESVTDENTIDIVTDVNTSESVADENTSESVADENTIGIVTDVNISESVTDVNTDINVDETAFTCEEEKNNQAPTVDNSSSVDCFETKNKDCIKVAPQCRSDDDTSILHTVCDKNDNDNEKTIKVASDVLVIAKQTEEMEESSFEEIHESSAALESSFDQETLINSR